MSYFKRVVFVQPDTLMTLYQGPSVPFEGRLPVTHVLLPLDVSQVSDAVVERVAQAICNAFADDGEYHPSWSHTFDGIRAECRVEARAAIAALAAALGEEG
jgi:hypothetical protein